MAQSRQQGDLLVTGSLVCGTFTPPAGCITNAAVASATGIDASKLDHQYQSPYSQAGGSASTADRRVVHVVRGATGTVQEFYISSRTACTSTGAITFDLYKNGSSILTGTVGLSSSDAAYTLKAGTLASSSLVAADVLEVVVTVSGSVIGSGAFAVVKIREDAD